LTKFLKYYIKGLFISLEGAMTVTSKTTTEMCPIRTYTEAIPFTGQIVAYKTAAFFYQANKSFSISSREGIEFAYVSDREKYELGKDFYQPTERFSISRVIAPNSVPRAYQLWDRILDKNPIFLRLATDSEIVEIGQALAADQAQFEYWFWYKEK
jgi:hypothetical protein